MTGFIITCIIVGALLAWAIFLLVIYFTSKNEMLSTGRKECLIWGITSLIFSAIFVVAFLSQYSQCPNPDCNEWVDSSYCQTCGWEVNPSVNCPACEKEFKITKIPEFCPDCGATMDKR